MTIDHLGEFLIGLEPLPLEACTPVLEKAPRPALAFIAPQLAEALLEDIGRVERLVGRQQRLQRLLAVEREVLLARQQRVFLALDVASVAAREPPIFVLANRIQGLAQMAHDMELVEQNCRLRGMCMRRQSKRLPHVHDRQTNARALAFAKPGVELAHARLRAILATKPNRPTAKQIADHDPISVTLADPNLVNTDHLRAGAARTLQLGFHVLLVQRLDRVPVQGQFIRHVLDCRLPAASADKVSKALGIERIVRQKVEPLPFHLATTAAFNSPHLQFQKYPLVSARQIAPVTHLAFVPPHVDATATAASRFFERRLSVITRAFGSPKMPRTLGCGRKPGKQYASHSRRRRFDGRAIQLECQIPSPAVMQNTYTMHRFVALLAPKFTHSIPRRPFSVIR